HRPRLGRAVVVGDEGVDRGLGGSLADVAAADAVGERHRDALGDEHRTLRNADAVEILVAFLAPGRGMLADANGESLAHVRSATGPRRLGGPRGPGPIRHRMARIS